MILFSSFATSDYKNNMVIHAVAVHTSGFRLLVYLYGDRLLFTYPCQTAVYRLTTLKFIVIILSVSVSKESKCKKVKQSCFEVHDEICVNSYDTKSSKHCLSTRHRREGLMMMMIIIIIIIITIIINLIYIAQFNTSSILTALYIAIQYIQMQYVHIRTYMKQSYSNTHTFLQCSCHILMYRGNKIKL